MLINKLNRDKLPFQYLSPSSVIEFLTNEKSFFKRYVLYKWDEKTSPALIMGTAYHFALEQYYNSIIENEKNPEIEILTDQEVINHGINELRRVFSYHEKRGLEKLIEDKSRQLEKKIDFEKFFDHYLNLVQFDWAILKIAEHDLQIKTEEKIPEEIIDPVEIENWKKNKEENIKDIRAGIVKMKDILIRAESFFQSIDLELDRDLGHYNAEIEEYKNYYIEYPKTQNKHTAEDTLIIGINNYMRDKPDIKPIVTEIAEIGEFQDFDGNDMPIALKGKPDLLGLYQNEDTIVDHKLVTTFGERNGAYEIQASSYYFIAQAILGKKPKKMIFVETIKKELNPASGMRKPELQGLCMEHNIEFDMKKDTIPVLVEKLMEKGILENPKAVNIIEIDFEEDPGIIQAFLGIYKEIVNRSYYFFIQKTLTFLPNPKADYTGPESWFEYKNEIVNEIDPIEALTTKEDKVVLDL